MNHRSLRTALAIVQDQEAKDVMDESSNAWGCPQILQYTRTTERERILSASWMLRL